MTQAAHITTAPVAPATALVSVIVPALNEAENLPQLTERVHQAMLGRDYELLIIDDNSRDGTDKVAADLAARFPLRLVVRAQPKDGLSGAVLHGIAQSRGDLLVVMDADLQHPPEMVPRLLEVLERGEGDFALGSRYCEGGTTEHKWGVFRKVNSRVATLLARPFAGRIADPMSGFFALRRGTWQQAQRLTPLGYKIALELMCKCRVQKVVEVPIHFARRQRGESTLSMREQFRYLEHLSRLYDFTFPRLSPCLKFLIAVTVGWFCGLGAIMGLAWTGIPLPHAVGLGYLAAVVSTAVFHLRYVRTQREFLLSPHPWRSFWTISLAEWASCWLAAVWLYANLKAPLLAPIYVISFAVATVVRYALRKELLEDIRGLRKELRPIEIVRQ